jgi:hypothetical protein
MFTQDQLLCQSSIIVNCLATNADDASGWNRKYKMKEQFHG